jgi:hypothetical protein
MVGFYSLYQDIVVKNIPENIRLITVNKSIDFNIFSIEDKFTRIPPEFKVKF